MPGSRVLDVGCGDGALLQLLADTKAVDGRGIELAPEKVNLCVMRGPLGDPGRRRPRPSGLPRSGFRLCDPVAHDPGDARSQNRARKPAQDRPACNRVVPELRALAGAGAASAHRAHARDAQSAGAMVCDGGRHLCTIKDFTRLVELVGAEVEDAVAFNSTGKRLPIKNSLSLQNLLGEKAVFKLTRKGDPSPRVCSFLTSSSADGDEIADGANARAFA